MPNTILHKRNSTPGTVPPATGLSQGELGINIADGKLYTKNSSNAVINLGITSISGTYITPSSGLFSNNVTASGFVRSGGTSSQFLKADGSIDSTAYQSLLTNPVTGTGTNGKLPKWSATSTLTDSIITESSSVLQIFGSIRGATDDTYLSFDANSNRVGITKKGGFFSKFTYGSTAEFAIAQSNLADILPSGTFTDRLLISSAGNIGIGVASPAEKLDILGNVKVAGANTSLTIAQDDTTTMRMRSVGNLIVGAGSAANVRFLISTTEHARLSDQGRFGIGLVAPSGKLGVAGGVTVGTNYNVTPPTDGMIIEGNVGIGTTSPGYKLQVAGSFGATTKSFRIDHPSKSGWNLEYGSLESPYHGVRLTGRGKVIKGVGVVSLPDYLKDLIHDDDTLNIQITNIKHGKIIYLEEIDLKNDRFIVKVDRAKSLGELQFCWTLTGVRKDVDHLVVEKRN